MSDSSADGSEGDDAEPATPAPPNGPDPTTPRVDLALHGLTVSVTGRSDDELDTVADHARDLMDYLADKSEELEDDRDEYGLS